MRLVCHVLDHFPTRLGTVAARLGAHRHFLVVGEFLAGRRTLVIALRATLAGGCGERTVSGAQSGGKFAAIRAIDARVHGLGMIFVPLGHQLGAVVKTGIAMDLTIGTGLGTLLEVSLVLAALGGERCPARSESGQASSRGGQRSPKHFVGS